MPSEALVSEQRAALVVTAQDIVRRQMPSSHLKHYTLDETGCCLQATAFVESALDALWALICRRYAPYDGPPPWTPQNEEEEGEEEEEEDKEDKEGEVDGAAAAAPDRSASVEEVHQVGHSLDGWGDELERKIQAEREVHA